MQLIPRRIKRRPRPFNLQRHRVPVHYDDMLMLAVFVLACVALLAARAADAGAATRMPAPRMLTPADGSAQKSVPTYSWAPVRGADMYQFQLSADPHFESIVLSQRRGSFKTKNTYATVDGALADSDYYWRVRAVSAKGAAGRWSAARSIRKRWASAPSLEGPADGTDIRFGRDALVMRWSRVDHAYKYLLKVATDPAMANSVLGVRGQGITTSGTAYAPQVKLPDGRYYWTVTPLDAAEHPGDTSAVGTFSWKWPTRYSELGVAPGSATSVSDAGAGWPTFVAGSPYYIPGAKPFTTPDVQHAIDPQLSWQPIPGAVLYEVEINHSEYFAAGSKMCCKETVTGTTMFPRNVLANNRYYWRVRALDSDGNAGEWNVGPAFQKDFDVLQDAATGQILPTVRNLRVVRHPDDHGTGDAGGAPQTEVPIVAWDPVIGASSYQVQVVERTSLGCNWTSRTGWDVVTAATAWTPLSNTWGGRKPGQISYERLSKDLSYLQLQPGTSYCVRVAAQSDRNEQRDFVVSDWTYLGGNGASAFTYVAPSVGTPRMPFAATASDYLTPDAGNNVRLPLFTWKPIPGARSYYVVVAKDQYFTEIRDVALTQVPAYAPRDGRRPWTYPDETTPYYWAVVPAGAPNGDDAPSPPLFNAPRSFGKLSNAPVLENAAGGRTPALRWSAVEGARTYVVQVARDESFSDLVEEVTTDSSGHSSSLTFPADSALHWRVRAADENKVGLRWSDPRTLASQLDAPGQLGGPTEGEGIPVLTWDHVQGAASYDYHVEQVDGTKRNFRMVSNAFTPVAFYGTGVWRWQVRANFPYGNTVVSSGYTGMRPFTRHIATPAGIRTRRSGGGIELSWAPAPMARRYRVEVAADDSFTRVLERVTTDNTSYAPRMTKTGFDGSRPLFWRVAAIDEGNNLGGWATTPLSNARTMRVQLKKSGRRAVRIRVTDARKRPVKAALVRVSGAGLRSTMRKRTGKRGTVTMKLKGAKRGKVLFHIEKRGYAPKDVKLRIR